MKAITTEDFDRLLVEAIDNDYGTASNLLSVPGIYEILAEYYNNEVLDAWKAEQAIEAGEDPDADEDSETD